MIDTMRTFDALASGHEGTFEDQGAHLEYESVLSVSVVPWCVRCVLMTCFALCVFERHKHRFVVDCGRPRVVASFLLPMPATAIF